MFLLTTAFTHFQGLFYVGAGGRWGSTAPDPLADGERLAAPSQELLPRWVSKPQYRVGNPTNDRFQM